MKIYSTSTPKVYVLVHFWLQVSAVAETSLLVITSGIRAATEKQSSTYQRYACG
ncbi:hypothetical protein E4N72_08150 [Treponema vincentii]|nr:hypothetical protein E4N72_08150 [Treponema vincentii]